MSDELMDPSEWLDEAKAIDVGTKHKTLHLCGDASLVVYNNIDSWTAWCWRCHTRGWVPKPDANMRERLARKAKQQELDNAISYQVRPPFPASFDLSTWTSAARVWLYRAGLTPAAIHALGAYYHAPTGRVVLPIRDSNGATVFWQARNPEYPSGGPKYISASVPRDRVHVQYGRVEGGSLLCLTEDILSAFKVGQSGAACGYAVMGTQLGTHTLGLLARLRPSSVLLWFDPDGAGDAARSVIGRQLRLIGIEPLSIVTDKDPKAYSYGEIRGIIDGVRSHTAPDHAGAEEVLPTAADG